VKKVQPGALHQTTYGTVSCGCHARARSTTHGLSKHSLYGVRSNMHTRCTNPDATDFKNWGGRGIKVCERWRTFENFRDDMGPSWRKGLLLDRVDNDGDYRPGNCRWVTWTVQNSNRRSTIRMPTAWGMLCLKHAAQRYGVPYDRFRQRYHQAA
jgi:hypothetical protein